MDTGKQALVMGQQAYIRGEHGVVPGKPAVILWMHAVVPGMQRMVVGGGANGGREKASDGPWEASTGLRL